jgi:uncharacterized cupredoxin-like copper-binding protein
MLTMALVACAAPPAPQPATPPATAAATIDWSRAETVTVTLDEFEFQPAELALPAGRPVRLHLVNRGGRAHDFTAPAFFQAVALREGDAVGAALRAQGGSIDVPAGASREVAIVPLRAGTYPLDCDKPLHGVLGMSGSITVHP